MLGELQLRAPGDGDRVVAQAPPEGLVHQVGDVVGDRDQNGVARRVGEAAVELAIGVAPALSLVGIGGVGGSRHHPEQAIDLAVSAGRSRCERHDCGLEDRTCLQDGRGAGVGGDPQQRAGVRYLDDERPGPLTRLDESGQL